MKKKKLPQIKKNITAFLSSEEGKISKKDAVKIGIGLAMAGIMLGFAGGAEAAHTNYFHNSGGQGSHVSHGSHGSHSSHSSHSSHGSHFSW